MEKIKVYLPRTCAEWLRNWLDFQRERPNQNKLENETVRHLLEICNRIEPEDFIIFNNAGGNAFVIWIGTDAVKSILSSDNIKRYVFCYKLNGKETIKQYFVWNRPRTYLNYFNISEKDTKNGFVSFDDDIELEVKRWGAYILDFPPTGIPKH